ncbi:uncharacterized protein LOC108603715 [Drosophila busckii]|uniref:uncharacterized protein LOC108603715 n=1 Tax=Drosophila busckii TaxID=30019 RepID=UPI00083EDDB5|nr:uncharacterized protein LOC108603715 [Drosophila busckii]
MKPSGLMLRLRQIWILSACLRNEAALSAAMLVFQRHEQHVDRAEQEQKQAAEVGLVGVDSQGKLRVVRVLDDYVVPAECGF